MMWFKRGILVAGLTLVAILGLLLFVVIAFAFRLVLIVVGILALLASVVFSCFSPRFREWFQSVGESQISYKGLRLATDIAVHPGHSWAALISPQNVAVGADDLVQAALGPVEAVDLPPTGSRIGQGDCLFSVSRAGRCVQVRSPMSGTVVATNHALRDHPGLINEGPFSGGWAVRLRADDAWDDRRRLLDGRQARGWFRHEVDRLIGTVVSDKAVTPLLADGGALGPDLYRQIDDNAWKRLIATFFGNATPV